MLTTTYDLSLLFPDITVRSSEGTSWQLHIEASPSRRSSYIVDPPAAPSSNGLVVYSTHIGPNARPDQDFGEPTMFVLAAIYPDGSVQWWCIPDTWQLVASDVWGTVLARRTDGRLDLAFAELPPPGVNGSPSTVDFETLIGREWSASTYASDLELQSQMQMGTQGTLGGGVIADVFDETSLLEFGFGGRHLVLLSDLISGGGVVPARFVVTAVLDLQLAADEQLSLSHIGCWVDGAYDDGVFAIIAPPIVNGSPDISADEWPARRAWRYAVSGPPVETDPTEVVCELAGE